VPRFAFASTAAAGWAIAIKATAAMPAAAAQRRMRLMVVALSLMVKACRVAGAVSSTLAGRRATR
jgi:hypothetical protein